MFFSLLFSGNFFSFFIAKTTSGTVFHYPDRRKIGNTSFLFAFLLFPVISGALPHCFFLFFSPDRLFVPKVVKKRTKSRFLRTKRRRNPYQTSPEPVPNVAGTRTKRRLYMFPLPQKSAIACGFYRLVGRV